VLYVVVEKFRHGAKPVYERASTQGRMLLAGLTYLDSWIDSNLTRCFQLMETEDPELLCEWISSWNDLVEFEIVSVITSSEAAQKVAEQA
jgi:hypothetical protein